MLPDLKGPGTIVARIFREHQRTELLRYIDESWGVRRNGFILGIWEPNERSDCFDFFMRLIGIEHEADLCILVPRLRKGIYFQIENDAKTMN